MRLPGPFGREAAERRGLARLAAAASAGPAREYAVTGLPAESTPAGELRLLAVDIETTGLDARVDQILSLGFVPVDGYGVQLAGARHIHVRPREGHAGVGASAAIHGLTDDQVAGGIAPAEALDLLFEALTGRVLLAHYAAIEVGFLGALCRAAYGCDLPVRTVDTLELGRRQLPAHREPAPGALRLWSLRTRFGLPVYAAHNALLDALACAELYLAQVAELESASATAVTLGALPR